MLHRKQCRVEFIGRIANQTGRRSQGMSLVGRMTTYVSRGYDFKHRRIKQFNEDIEIGVESRLVMQLSTLAAYMQSFPHVLDILFSQILQCSTPLRFLLQALNLGVLWKHEPHNLSKGWL